jgi:hypothetical protein
MAEDADHAERVERLFAHCRCEEFSVGIGSPGRVDSEEYIYRMVISPGDVDQTGTLRLDAVRDVKIKGLSVFRDIASDADIESLVVDRLTRKTANQPARVVQALIKLKVEQVRDLSSADFGRYFGIYDETVPRRDPDLERVPTHATVLQRLHLPGTDNRKGKITDVQRVLFEQARLTVVSLSGFRGGLIERLNERSLANEFIMPQAV